MKLRRVYETAEEEGRSVAEVALDRFGSMDEFEAAKEERRVLDEREGRRAGRDSTGKGKSKDVDGERYVFTEVNTSGASSRSSSFRRPGLGDNTPTTPSPAGSVQRKDQYDTLRLSFKGSTGSPLARSSRTPVPSVLTPTAALPVVSRRAMSPSSLNKLQAKVLRAKLVNAPNAAALEKQYDEEARRANGALEEDTGMVSTLR